MSLIKTPALAFAIAIAACCVSPPRSLAQTWNSAPQDDHEQTLRQLLTEVRELRLVLQRAAFSSTRFQMLLERLRVEQTHVDSLRRDLESVRSQLAELQAEKP